MIWRWSVDLAADTAFDGRPIQHVPVATLAAITGADAPEETVTLMGSRVDTAYAMSDAIDLTQPIIVGAARYTDLGMDVPDGAKEAFTILLDGSHRIYRAYKQGSETLPCLILDADETEACRLVKDAPRAKRSRK